MRALLLVVALALNSGCATTSAAGGVNGAAMSLKATGQLFLATAAALDSAYDMKAISELQYAPWRDFSVRFQAAYKLADKVMEKAVESNDQSVQGVVKAELDNLATELATFQALAAQVVQPRSPP